MKTNLYRNWKVVLTLAILPALAAGVPGFGPGMAAAQTPAGGISGLVAAEGPADAPVANQAADNSIMPTAAPPAPVSPPNVQLYGGTAEIAKLAQGGVGDNVMLSYITNTSFRFALTSDQIIYLNDLGVSSAVITAMLQHDASGNGVLPPTTAPDTAVNPANSPMPDDYSTLPPPAAESAPYPDTGYAPAYADQTPEYPAGYPAVDDAGYFYDSLAPYGNWITVAGDGLVWQPTVVVGNRGWRPYGDRGRWLYTDSGWYWQSDYSWGWAAFHYGRWDRRENLGWVWVPGRTWGPGWVSWRTTGDYAGWAPLPPSARFDPAIGFSFQNRRVGAGFDFGLSSSLYTFVPVERLSDYSPTRYGVTRTVGAKIFDQSVVVNNLALLNQQVVNLGVNPQRVEAAGGTPVRMAHVRDAAAGDNRFRTDRLEKRGDSLVISRPQLPSVNAAAASSGRVRAAATAPVSSVRAASAESAATLASVAAARSRVHVTYNRDFETAPTVASIPAPGVNNQFYPVNPIVRSGQRSFSAPQAEAGGETVQPGPEPATSYSPTQRGEGARTYNRSDNTSSRSDGRTGRIGYGPSSFGTGADPSPGTAGDVPRGDAGRGFQGGSGQTMPARQGPPSGGNFGTVSPRQASAPTYGVSSSQSQPYSTPAPASPGGARTYSGPAQNYSGPSQSYHGSAPSSSSSSSSSQSSSGRGR